jgi:tetratricopeptide (TPR) repeat protein
MVLATLTVVLATSVGRSSSEIDERWVLVSDIEGVTDDGLLVGAVRSALSELASGGRINEVPRDRIDSVLRLMRKPPDTPIDVTIGRELSLRDGAVDALVTLRIERVGSAHRVGLMILEPHDAVVATFSAEAADRHELLREVREQVVRMRQTLLDRPSESDRPSLPKLTTKSLDALGLYSAAVVLMDQVPMKPRPAYSLLVDAIDKDPEFASAHILAAWALRNAGRGRDEFLPHAERAFALADSTSGVERYYILGGYHQLRNEVEQAITAYEALRRLEPVQPLYYWALGNLGRLYREMGQYAAASEVRLRQVEMRPRQFWGAFSLAEALFLKGDFEGARDYAAHAADLASKMDAGELRRNKLWLQILPACEAWLQNDVPRAVRLASELDSDWSHRPVAERDALALGLGYVYLTLGHLDRAELTFRRLPRGEWRDYHLALVRSHYGVSLTVIDHTRAVAKLGRASGFPLGLPALDSRLLPLLGDFLTRSDADLEDPDILLIRGQVGLVKGLLDQAIPLLERSIRLRDDPFAPAALVARESLAEAWIRKGDLLEAVRILAEASQHRTRSCLWPAAGGHLWLRIRARLAHLQRQLGREQEAQVIEAELSRLLESADARHPLRERSIG